MNDDDEFEASVDEAYAQMCKDWAAGLDEEHKRVDEPTESALLHRPMEIGGMNYIETAWVHGYPRIRSIVLTCPKIRLRTGGEMPGVVREIPVRSQSMASPETFRQAFEKVVTSYLDNGWTMRKATI